MPLQIFMPMKPGKSAHPRSALRDAANVPIDLLIVTALTEEAQIVAAVLSEVATIISDDDDDVVFYSYLVHDGTDATIAAASAHEMGGRNMGIFASRLLDRVRPCAATLVGIAASINTEEIGLGDVPFASHVFAYDDIAVDQGVLTFRHEGFQVDPSMRKAAGKFRTTRSTYSPWQDECVGLVGQIARAVSEVRPRQVTTPPEVRRPHLVVDPVAGGPFLLRDAGFRDALRKKQQELDLEGVKVEAPIHSKILAAEMESCGFMKAASENDVPATVIKGISDVGDDEKARIEKESGGFYRMYACSNAVLATLHIMRQKWPKTRVARQAENGKGQNKDVTQRSRKRKSGISRRTILAGISVPILGALAVKFSDQWLLVEGLAKAEVRGGENRLLRNIIDPEGATQFFAGNTNRLALAEGKHGLSPYLRRASANLLTFATQFAAECEEVPPRDSRLLFDAPHNDLILMGGPVANNLYARASCHKFRIVQPEERVCVPKFDLDSGLRWGFDVGAHGYGRHDPHGQQLKVKRYDEYGNLVERPLYGIRDVTDAGPTLMEVDRDGFLQQDALLITRIPNWFYPERKILLIGGVHGYSVDAFGRELVKNLEQIQSMIGNAELFQLLVPASLTHKECMTIATLRWNHAKLQVLQPDYRGKRFNAWPRTKHPS